MYGTDTVNEHTAFFVSRAVEFFSGKRADQLKVNNDQLQVNVKGDLSQITDKSAALLVVATLTKLLICAKSVILNLKIIEK